MKFVCERCHTKYSIADEKVRGKVLKVRCKTCENVITVRESGATIDDSIAAGPKEAPIARSGTLDAGPARLAAAADHGVRSRAGVAGTASAAAATARAPMPEAAFHDPLAPAVAPPPRRRAPTPMPAAAPVDDGIDWYLAVDGAQTGPFLRATLIEKIVAVPAGGDIHVWNAGLGAWKPPKDVPEVHAELLRLRRPAPPAPPAPPPRRPSGPIPSLVASGAGSNGLSAFNEPSDTQISKGPPVGLKRNGFRPTPASGSATRAQERAQEREIEGFGLEDLFEEGGLGTETPAPGSLAASGAAEVLARAVSASSPAVTAAVAPPRSGRQVKLVLGAMALVVIVCGIVAVALLRKPTPAPPVAGGKVATGTAGPSDPNASAKAAAPTTPAAVEPPTPPAVEPPPIVAKVDSKADSRSDSSGKGARGKGHRKGQNGAPPTSPPPIGPMTAEQKQAASRFGDASGRDLRVPTSSAPTARSMPAQADISRVISNNRQGIQTCYQRALLRDSTLTQGKVTVRVSIGISGKVKSVSLDAPLPFRSMESCVRDVMSRWAFPPSSEEYGTEFPVVLQGNN